MADNWGPWIEHDGKGCPCPGAFVRVEGYRYSGYKETLAVMDGVANALHYMWEQITPGGNQMVIRYRIRKPRGMAILESILADVTEPAQEKAET